MLDDSGVTALGAVERWFLFSDPIGVFAYPRPSKTPIISTRSYLTSVVDIRNRIAVITIMTSKNYCNDMSDALAHSDVYDVTTSSNTVSEVRMKNRENK